VYDYTIRGHTELLSIHVLYVQDVYISIHYTYIYVQSFYLLLIQLKYITHISSFWCSSFRQDCGSLVTQTLPVSDCWHLMLSKHLALSLTLSALPRTVLMLQ